MVEGSHKRDGKCERTFMSHLNVHQRAEVKPNAACQAASFCASF